MDTEVGNAMSLVYKMNNKLIQIARLVLVALSCVLANGVLAFEPVGHVLLVTGDATRIDAEGASHSLADRSPVFEGDTLETASAATMQIKMVDNALLVLQPQSTLVIHQYNFRAESPDGYAVRLDLVKGRARSVTGDLGESNHDAFRLNTPIAAIGIRGTDFETTTTDAVTRVRLNSGAIVFSALGDDCTVSSLGPCATPGSLVLSEDLDSPAAELRASDPVPRIIELPAYESDDQGSSLNEQKDEEKINAEKQAERIVERAGTLTPPPAGENPGGQPQQPVIDQIHWGRWGGVVGIDAPSYGELAEAGKETLFRNDLLFLFRDGFLAFAKGQASFELQSYQAGTVSGGQFAPVNLSSGKLFINFDERKFETGLTASSDAIGGLQLSASGNIDSRGLLRSDQGNMTVLGGLAGDSTQAGYLFTHTINESMSLQGATQWQWQP